MTSACKEFKLTDVIWFCSLSLCNNSLTNLPNTPSAADEQEKSHGGEDESGQGEDRQTNEKRSDDRDSGYSRKRSREDDERGGRHRPDPSRAPDPEEPESFDETEAGNLMGDEFRPPEDDNVVVLDKCKSRDCVCMPVVSTVCRMLHELKREIF